MPPSSPHAQSTIDETDSDVVNEDFERVQWAKCQARAERYEEEVQLTVEEMGRTLRYFEWKRDWWLSLVPTKSNSPPDVLRGLRAYAHRQSHLYDDLVTSYVLHWRTYLSARSLSSSWLDKYASRAGPTPAQSSQKADVLSPPTPIRIPASLSLPAESELLVDPPLRSESDNDSDWGDDVETLGDSDDFFHAEDLLDDD